MIPKIPSDVVFCVFGLLDAGTRVRASKPEIMAFFYAMSKKERFKKIFKDFIFDTRDYSPYCEQVDSALSNLHACSMLSMIDLKDYEVTSALTRVHSLGLFNKKEKKLLKEVALELEVGKNDVKVYKPSWHKNYGGKGK